MKNQSDMRYPDVRFDVSVSIQIDFLAEEKDIIAKTDFFSFYLESLYVCLGVEFDEKLISLYDGSMGLVKTPILKPYYLTAFYIIDALSYANLQLLERTITNITTYWNQNIFMYNGKSCSYSFQIYQQGERP